MNSKSASMLSLNLSHPWYVKTIVKFLQRSISKGQLTIQSKYGSFDIIGKNKGYNATLKINHWRTFLYAILRGDIGLAESYRDGDFETENLTQLFLLALDNHAGFSTMKDGLPFGTTIDKISNKLNKNTRFGSRKNIHKHYDLGNDFFSLWLDASMTYSSAYFAGDRSQDLYQAQIAKYEQIFNLTGVKPGQHILEIGCGWGGFAEYAAKRGVKVTGITISKEQLHFAQQRMEKQNLSQWVTLKMLDYRDLTEQFDAVVSIEMIEAVGEEYWSTYFNKIADVLKPGAKAVIQGITIEDKHFAAYRSGTDFIQKYIFPGAVLIPLSKIKLHGEKAGLKLQNHEYFGLDYAETLRRWEIKFNLVTEKLIEMGYDSKFQKIWNFYLCYCQAGFLNGRINVTHAVLENK